MAWTRETELSPGVITRETELTAVKYIKEWLKNFGYEVGDKVLHNNIKFSCKLAHYSLANTEPGIGADWATYWDTSAKDWTNDEAWEDRDNTWANA